MMSNENKRRSNLSLETLEERTVLSVTGWWLWNGTLKVECNDAPSNVTIVRNNPYSSSPTYKLTDSTNGYQASFSTYDVTKIRFVGGAAADSFKVIGCFVDVEAWGNGGNDFLEGSYGNDWLVGGAGNDSILGRDGEDMLNGGVGNDRLFGGNDDDRLFGAAGNDYIKGGLGSDRIYGGAGIDVLDDAGGYGVGYADWIFGERKDTWLVDLGWDYLRLETP